jgi:poly(glycerol-phosphate) alpha-glucosyltransferase
MQESMSHGCPVIAYDVKYGPREQITDGVTGFLVPDGDKARMAERLVQLLTSPELVQKISAASIEQTARSSTDYVEQWQAVLEKVVAQAPRRTTVRKVTLDTHDLRVTPAGRLSRTLGKALRFAPGQASPADTVHVTARVTVHGTSKGSDLSAVALSLAAVHPPSGHYVELPIEVNRTKKRFHVRSDFSLADALVGAPLGAGVSLRLQLVWENSTWQGFLGRPEQALDRGTEVGYDDEGAVRLRAWADVDG